MEIPASEPTSTASAEGGISMAMAPDAMIGPIAMEGWYPRFSIPGSRVEPSMAVLAMVDPDSAAKIVPPKIVTTDIRPGRRVTTRSMASMARCATPVWNRISPIRMNSGMGAS